MSSPQQTDPRVMEGVVQRLAADLAQMTVTCAELDTRLQLSTADVVRLEGELAKHIGTPADPT